MTTSICLPLISPLTIMPGNIGKKCESGDYGFVAKKAMEGGRAETLRLRERIWGGLLV